MRIIGICGSSGCGKSSVCRAFREFGAAWLDCDAIYHELVSGDSPCLRHLQSEFGDAVIQNGALNRKAMREIVFRDKNKLQQLNAITHHYVLIRLKELIEEERRSGRLVCLIDAPMFFEANLQSWCDLVIAVICEESVQLKRVCERDHISTEQAKDRLRNQFSNEVLRERAHYIIENNGTEEELFKVCEKIYHKIILKGVSL